MNEITNSKLIPDRSIESLDDLFKEQLRLLGRLLVALRNMTPLAKPAPELMLVVEPQDEEIAATD